MIKVIPAKQKLKQVVVVVVDGIRFMCFSNNNIIRTLAVISKWKLGLFLSKYLIPSINIVVSDSENYNHLFISYGKMSHMETLCRHGTQQWKNTVLLEFVNVHFQCITFYVLICSDCVVV